MSTKTMTIPASDLRVGDKIINWGEVLKVHSATDDGFANINVRDRGRTYWKLDQLLTIERHEPEVTERWYVLYSDDSISHAFNSLAMALSYQEMSALGAEVIKRIRHDGKLHSVQIVENTP